MNQLNLCTPLSHNEITFIVATLFQNGSWNPVQAIPPIHSPSRMGITDLHVVWLSSNKIMCPTWPTARRAIPTDFSLHKVCCSQMIQVYLLVRDLSLFSVVIQPSIELQTGQLLCDVWQHVVVVAAGAFLHPNSLRSSHCAEFHQLLD